MLPRRKDSLKLGTRGSDLALVQATMVRQALESAHPGIAVEQKIVRTIGDKRPDLKLSEFSEGAQPILDKGIFTRELELSLEAGEISLHTDMLAHGSEPNNSDRRRCGFNIRYCHVDARMGSGWNFNSILCRGSDPAGYWADNPRPTGDNTSPVTRPEK